MAGGGGGGGTIFLSFFQPFLEVDFGQKVVRL